MKFHRKTTQEEMKEIENLANLKITECVPIQILELSRKETITEFGNEIYDLFPIPPEIKTLKIVVIENWNINVCNKPHTKTTGNVGKIKIKKWRFRRSKELLEISFDIE